MPFWSKANLIDLEQLEQMAEIVTKYQLDSLEISGVKIHKSKHLTPDTQTPTQSFPKTNTPIDPDEALAWSTLNAGRY